MGYADQQKRKEYLRQWKAANREKVRGYARVSRAADPEKHRKWVRNWVERHPDEARQETRKRVAAYRERHGDELRRKKRERHRDDLAFKLRSNLRSRLYCALHNDQKGGSAVRDLGCTIPELKAWLERWFMEGMSWENYGSEWHIDHITPLIAFDLTDPEQCQAACFFLNLQPLWKVDNLRKGARVVV